MKDFFFRPPSPSYDRNYFDGELCSLDGIDCLALASVEKCSYLVLYCHGNTEDIGQCRNLLHVLRSLLGVHVIGVEYPGYGITHSSQKTTEENMNESVLRVYNFLCKRMNWPPENIIVVGRSIGSGPATQLARDVPIGGLILVSAFKSITSIAAKFVGESIANLVVANQYDNLSAIHHVHCPVLFLHGLEDDFIPFQHSQDLYNACASSRKTLTPLLGYGHNNFDWTIPVKRMDDFFVAHDVIINRRYDIRRMKRMDEFFTAAPNAISSDAMDYQAYAHTASAEESNNAESEVKHACSWSGQLELSTVVQYRELDKFLFEGRKVFDSQQFDETSFLSSLGLPPVFVEDCAPFFSAEEAKRIAVEATPALTDASQRVNPEKASQRSSRSQSSNNIQPPKKHEFFGGVVALPGRLFKRRVISDPLV